MGKNCLSCRTVLWILVFCGFGMNYMLRINLNLAIVAMVVPRLQSAASLQCGTQKNISHTTIFTTTIAPSQNVKDQRMINSRISSISQFEDRFQWNEYEQSLALGSYYWLHWLSQLPGGLLARRYGTKVIFGWANLITALLGLIIPVATSYHLSALIFLRVIQGLVAGVSWPAMHGMTAKWIPPQERSKFVSSYLGSSVGAAITYPLCALVISWFDWQSAFYVTSILGIIWFCFWQFLVFDSPDQHPRISMTERSYILENLSETNQEKKIPWKAIVTSGPLWIVIVAHFGGSWGFLTMMTQAPSYFNYIHGWDVNAAGVLSGLPHILRMMFSYGFGVLGDWLLRTKRMSLTNVRKLATFMCTILQGFLTLGLSYSGCFSTLAIIFMMTGTAVNGAVSAGTLAALVDLSSNYASVILGFCNLITAAAGYISPFVVGLLTNNNQTIERWRLVFIISAILLILSGIIFILFGTSVEQSWNNYRSEEREENAEEMKKLRSKSNLQNHVNEKEQLSKRNEEKA
ncbi:sialin isoform X2 [Belonocnema kinseyi]|uniref:sialin isoform X2 n=1 Tax=Belonocnema kinseyi TaxID=2817044 RepID=UPI00143D6C73|nr:sialin isoform X2 [Belonocnema kinseyi]